MHYSSPPMSPSCPPHRDDTFQKAIAVVNDATADDGRGKGETARGHACAAPARTTGRSTRRGRAGGGAEGYTQRPTQRLPPPPPISPPPPHNHHRAPTKPHAHLPTHPCCSPGKGSKQQQQAARGSRDQQPKDESDIYKLVRMLLERNLDPLIVFSFSKKECEALAAQVHACVCGGGGMVCVCVCLWAVRCVRASAPPHRTHNHPNDPPAPSTHPHTLSPHALSPHALSPHALPPHPTCLQPTTHTPSPPCTAREHGPQRRRLQISCG